MTLSRPPQCRAFSRAVLDGKSLSPRHGRVTGREAGGGGKVSGYK